MGVQWNTATFIERAKQIHNNRYTYEHTIYTKAKDSIIVTCPKHGDFKVNAWEHLHGAGCIECQKIFYAEKKRAKYAEKFVKEAIIKHNNKYDYSMVEYLNSHTKVCIICPEHGEFWQTPNDHLHGYGCRQCAIRSNANKHRLETSEFIQKAKEIHGDKYDYSKVEYVHMFNKVCIVCPIHGEFWQTPVNHLSGKGCRQCANETNALHRLTGNVRFIQKAKEIHGDKYDYSKVEYKKNKVKVCIICPEHGEFWQTPSKHLHGNGCPQCAIHKRVCKRIKKFNIFVEESKSIFGDVYTYDETAYIDSTHKTRIICPEHGEYWLTPNKHISRRQGCPQCSANRNVSETLLYEWLCRRFPKEEIIHQYFNKDIIGKQSIDIYFPKYKIAIEYQGKQHFKPVDYFGGYNAYLIQKENDIKKHKICMNNGITVLYFTYTKADISKNYFNEVIHDQEQLANIITDLIKR